MNKPTIPETLISKLKSSQKIEIFEINKKHVSLKELTIGQYEQFLNVFLTSETLQSPTAPIHLDNLIYNILQNNTTSNILSEITILDKIPICFAIKWLLTKNIFWRNHIDYINTTTIPPEPKFQYSLNGVNYTLSVPSLQHNYNYNEYILANENIGLSDLVILNWMKFVTSLEIDSEIIDISDIKKFADVVYELPSDVFMVSEPYLKQISAYIDSQCILKGGKQITIDGAFFSTLNNSVTDNEE